MVRAEGSTRGALMAFRHPAFWSYRFGSLTLHVSGFKDLSKIQDMIWGLGLSGRGI